MRIYRACHVGVFLAFLVLGWLFLCFVGEPLDWLTGYCAFALACVVTVLYNLAVDLAVSSANVRRMKRSVQGFFGDQVIDSIGNQKARGQ